jgi:hypothetical protein
MVDVALIWRDRVAHRPLIAFFSTAIAETRRRPSWRIQ